MVASKTQRPAWSRPHHLPDAASLVRKELRPERFMALERREKIEGGELQSVQKEQNANNLQNYQQCFKYHGHHLGWIAKELSLTICSIRLCPNAK
jgi:hypothetical protein